MGPYCDRSGKETGRVMKGNFACLSRCISTDSVGRVYTRRGLVRVTMNFCTILMNGLVTACFLLSATPVHLPKALRPKPPRWQQYLAGRTQVPVGSSHSGDLAVKREANM